MIPNYAGFLLELFDTLSVESFTDKNICRGKLSGTLEVKILRLNFQDSREFGGCLRFEATFSGLLRNISRTTMKVQFRGYKLCRVAKNCKIAKVHTCEYFYQ